MLTGHPPRFPTAESSPRRHVRSRRRPRARLALALVALVTVAGVTPVGAAEARPRIDQEQWLEWQIADAITQARQSPRSVDPHADEPAAQPLTGWSDLRGFAQQWADAMADRRTMAHNPAFADGYCCWQKAGEVLAKLSIGEVTSGDLAGVADRAVRAWFDSPVHRSAVLDGAYDQVGVGVTIDHAAETVWVAVDLRQLEPGSSPPGSAWYRPGSSSPSPPAAGWPCDGDAAPYGATTWPLPSSSLVRQGGGDRVATSLAVSNDVDSPDTVLLASAASPSDALAAAGLAGTSDAPVVLTGPSRLDDDVAAQLRSWRPSRVVLLGGPRALSASLASDVGRAAPSAQVERLQGGDRFATAAAIAGEVADRGGNDGRVVLALGDHPQPSRSWADAVAISGLAASHDHPVLLTRPTSLPSTTRAALERLAPDHVVVPGGPSGVSDGVLDAVRAAVPGARVDRVAGASRYETSRAVVALDQKLRGTATRAVHVVHGEHWPDALTAGPAAARAGAVVAMIDGSAPGDGGLAHLDDLSDSLRRLDVTLVGGTAAISRERAAEVAGLLHCLE